MTTTLGPWQHIADINPKGGEQYLCMRKDLELYTLHFCAPHTGEVCKWYVEGAFGFNVAQEPTVAALIDPSGGVDIWESIDE